MSEIPDWGSKTKKESFWGLAAAAAKQLIPFVLVPVALTQLAPAMVIPATTHFVSRKSSPFHPFNYQKDGFHESFRISLCVQKRLHF